MKTIPSALLAILATCLLAFPVFAAEPSPFEPAAEKKAPKDPQWNVRVEVLMVALPEEKALALLPELRDSAKIEGAVTEIMAAIKRKEATLMGYPVVVTLDGERGVSETIFEKRYPTEFEPPTTPQTAGQTAPAPAGAPISEPAFPTAFEVRNVGVTLEVEPEVSAKGDWIRVDVVPQRVELLGFDTYDAVKTASGLVVKADQPRFATSKTTTRLKLHNGESCLLAVHKLVQPENQIELFIIQASATPVK
jgi:hypothetical protein